MQCFTYKHLIRNIICQIAQKEILYVLFILWKLFLCSANDKLIIFLVKIVEVGMYSLESFSPQLALIISH